MTDGPRFTVCEMRPRDWNLLASTLPADRDCTGLQQDLRWFAWGNGWHTRDGRPYGENGRKYHRRIWKGLAGGPCQVGPFRIERVGRWGIMFVLDVTYAAQRTRLRRRTCLAPGGLDAAFERDFQRRLRCASIGTFGN
jgi:hypothetical protein